MCPDPFIPRAWVGVGVGVLACLPSSHLSGDTQCMGTFIGPRDFSNFRQGIRFCL